MGPQDASDARNYEKRLILRTLIFMLAALSICVIFVRANFMLLANLKSMFEYLTSAVFVVKSRLGRKRPVFTGAFLCQKK